MGLKATYEDRLPQHLYPLLEAIAAHMAHIQHRPYVDLYARKADLNEVKSRALVAYGGQFNAVSRSLAGKVQGEQASEGRARLCTKAHHKRRYLARLEAERDKVKADR